MNSSLTHWNAVVKILSTLLLLISSFTMTQRFYSVSARNWFTLDSVQLQSNGLTASFIGSRGIYAPAEYSFHCQSVSSFQHALLVPNNTNQNTTQWRLNFVDFQVQLQHQHSRSNASSIQVFMESFFFNNQVQHCLFIEYSCFFMLQIQGFGLSNRTDFSYASDCAGFFTPGIWMGLLTSLLMLYIFVYGLHMIMQLNTMDRFDDPKGPSISVPQMEWNSPQHTHTLLSPSVPPRRSLLVISSLFSF